MTQTIDHHVQPRMAQPPVTLVPGALQAVLDLGAAALAVGLPKATHDLVQLRASQINGCSFCVHLHARDLRRAGESDERIDTVAAWRESPWFTPAERAALALAECLTRLADRGEAVPDEVWTAAAAHYGEAELASLLVSIAAVNVWNRLNAANQQPAASIPL